MEECPICLEPLTGTIVHLGCCKKQVHIQCYISKCPMCRAQLPDAPYQVIVPVPVPYIPPPPPPTWKKGLASLVCCLGTIISVVVIFSPRMY